MVVPVAGEMDRIRADRGIWCVDSSSSVFQGMMHQIVVDTSKWVLATLTTLAGAVDRKDTLRATVLSRTCGTVVVMNVVTDVAMVLKARKATIPPISSLGEFTQLVGGAAELATMLTSAITRRLIFRVALAEVEWWRIHAGFVGKTRICQLTVQLNCRHRIS